METTSEAFRQVFARFSRGFRFKNIFVKGSREQKKNNFCVPRGPPPRGAAEPGPPRHAKIGKNGTVTVNDLNQRRYIKNLTWCLRFEQILQRIQMGRCQMGVSTLNSH